MNFDLPRVRGVKAIGRNEAVQKMPICKEDPGPPWMASIHAFSHDVVDAKLGTEGDDDGDNTDVAEEDLNRPRDERS